MGPLSRLVSAIAIDGWGAASRASKHVYYLELPDGLVSTEAFDSAPENLLAEMLRLAELRHASLLQIATAADARAVQVLAGSAALTAAAFGAAAGLTAAGKASELASASAVSGLLFAIAALLAAWSARPEPVYRAPGLEPVQIWAESVLSAQRRDLLLIAIGEAQRAIGHAARNTVRRARALNSALVIGSSALPTGSVTWLALLLVASG